MHKKCPSYVRDSKSCHTETIYGSLYSPHAITILVILVQDVWYVSKYLLAIRSVSYSPVLLDTISATT